MPTSVLPTLTQCPTPPLVRLSISSPHAHQEPPLSHSHSGGGVCKDESDGPCSCRELSRGTWGWHWRVLQPWASRKSFPSPQSVRVTVMVILPIKVTLHRRFTEHLTNLLSFGPHDCPVSWKLFPLDGQSIWDPEVVQVTGGAGAHPVPGSLRPHS